MSDDLELFTFLGGPMDGQQIRMAFTPHYTCPIKKDEQVVVYADDDELPDPDEPSGVRTIELFRYYVTSIMIEGVDTYYFMTPSPSSMPMRTIIRQLIRGYRRPKNGST